MDRVLVLNDFVTRIHKMSPLHHNIIIDSNAWFFGSAEKVSVNFSIDFWQGGCKETNQIALWLYEQK